MIPSSELSIWVINISILLVISLRDLNAGCSGRVTNSFHISSLVRRTVSPQLFRSVLPIGCVHLLGVYDKNNTQAILYSGTGKRHTHTPSLDHRDSSQVTRTRHRALLPFRTSTSQTSVPKVTYANTPKAKHARLADTVLQRLCALAVPARQTG